MGLYDVPAMLTKVTEVAGVDKLTYIGYSMGTSQMFYALATGDATVTAKVDRAILMAPSIYIMDEGDDGKSKPYTFDSYEETVGVYNSEGVYILAGPNADEDEQKVCTPTPDDYLPDKRKKACDNIKIMKYFKGLPVNFLA